MTCSDSHYADDEDKSLFEVSCGLSSGINISAFRAYHEPCLDMWGPESYF